MISKEKCILIFSFVIQSLLLQVNAAEGDAYKFSWLDPDKEVYVLQNRKYRKADRLHLNLGFGKTTNGAFVDATTIQGRAGYFFHENWGVEFVFAKNSGEENGTADSIRGDGVRTAGTVPFRRIIDNYYGGMLMWSPFYSKINTFNKIIYVDWLLGLGLAKLTETNNLREFKTTNSTAVSETLDHTGLIWDAGMKVYLTEHFEVRLDLTVLHYKANKATRTSAQGESVWNSNWDLALSLGYTF